MFSNVATTTRLGSNSTDGALRDEAKIAATAPTATIPDPIRAIRPGSRATRLSVSPLGVTTASSACSSSSALAGRAAACFSRHRIVRAASRRVAGSFRSSPCSRSSGSFGASAMCAAIICCEVFRSAKGCDPVSNSYAITPQEYRSARASTSSPTACSGAMYAGVPSDVPTCVSVPPGASVFETSSALAIPKSVTTAVPEEMSTFSGLMSRWTIPCPCAYASACATFRRMPMPSPSGTRPTLKRARNESPRTKGIV